MREPFRLRARDHLDTSEGKRHFNEAHFAESAPRYDLATRGLSFGRDESWKRRMVAGLPDLRAPSCVDVACGTGDLTFLLAEKYADGYVLGVDLTAEMIEIARGRNRHDRVRFHCGDMTNLPLDDGSVDLLTGGYAIRNAPDLGEVLREFSRVVKPGGTLAFLDFSKPPGILAQKFQYHLLHLWGGFWGLVLHGNPEVHGYISSSIRTFPDRDALESLFEEHGFAVAERVPLLGGMMRIHFLRKSAGGGKRHLESNPDLS